jgi:preprotein translocase subunit SecE
MNREMRRLAEREERRQKEAGGPAPRRRALGGARPPGSPERPSLWQRLRQFLREVRTELQRVSWPSRQQMIAFVSVTLITSIALTLVVFGFDIVMKNLVLLLVDRTLAS